MNHDARYELLNEIKKSLATQNKLLAEVASSESEIQSPADDTDTGTQISRMSPGKPRLASSQGFEDTTCGAQDKVELRQTRHPVHSLDTRLSRETMAHYNAPSSEGTQLLTALDLINRENRPGFEIRLSSAQDDPFYSWPVSSRSTIFNDFPTLVVNRHASTDYTSAPRILSLPKDRLSNLGFTDDELVDYRQSLGEFQHLPCDFRLHHPFDAFTKQEVLAHIKTAADFIHCLESDRISGRITIYDCDSTTGLHAYSVTEYRRDKSRLKVTPECEGGISTSWSRLIVCKGLLEAENFSSFSSPAYFLASHRMYAGMQLENFIKRSIKSNPAGTRIGKLNESMTTMDFSVTSFVIVPKCGWKPNSQAFGPLYGYEDSILTQDVSALYAVSGEGTLRRGNLNLSSYPDYTIFLVTPRAQKRPLRVCSKSGSSMHWHVLDIIWTMLSAALSDWRNILGYICRLLQDDRKLTTILSPEIHDGLLFEDETYSRSRKYFWAIDALEVFEESIMRTVSDWYEFRRDCVDPFKLAKGVVGTVPVTQRPCWMDPTELLGRIERCIEELESTRDEFRDLRGKAEVMRTALFSASAVIETRAAAQLGENVRLLAYVSIFYLPLAFCTSLWSIDHIPSQPTFACVVVAVASATYLVVFNLQSIVALARRPYDGYRRMIVKQMKTDTNPNWIETARNFEQFSARRESVILTSWLLPLYSLLRIASLIGLRRTAPSSAALEAGSDASEHNSVETVEVNLPSSSSKSSLVGWLKAWSPLKGAINTTKADADPPSEQDESAHKAHQSGWIRRIARRRDMTNLASSVP